jgi:hypothetical protein
MTTKAKSWTINDIQAAMSASGSHWWDRSSMRFFGTRVCGAVFQGQGGIYFVTSEQPPHGPRAYTIRRFTPESLDIRTEGELCGYKTRKTALRHAERLAGAACELHEDQHKPLTEADTFLRDCRKHGDPDASGAIVERLINEAKRHHRFMELLCSDERFCSQVNEDGEHPQVVTCRELIEDLAGGVGAKGVQFSGDPRGCTVKLRWADGETNDFGKEGWCVPVNAR